MDYEGEMGVPVSFMSKYNPKQFEIIGLSRYVLRKNNKKGDFKLNGKTTYQRIVIKRTV